MSFSLKKKIYLIYLYCNSSHLFSKILWLELQNIIKVNICNMAGLAAEREVSQDGKWESQMA